MSVARENLERAVEAVNKGDVAAFAATYAMDAVLHDPSYPEPLHGREAVARDMETFLAAFPDLRASFDTVLEAVDRSANRWRFEGTNTGAIDFPSFKAQATGKTMKVEGGAFSRYNAAGEVVEEHRYYDNAGIAAQLGLA